MSTAITTLAHQPPSLVYGGSGLIQSSGSGDNPAITIRTQAEGTIDNTVATLKGQVDDGVINIQGCTTINLFILFIKGSLTNATLSILFGGFPGTTIYPMKVLTIASGLIEASVDSLIFAPWTGNLTGVIQLPNPGANSCVIRLGSSGTITSSSLSLTLTRGFGTPPSFIAVS